MGEQEVEVPNLSIPFRKSDLSPFDYSFEQTSNGIKVTQDFKVESGLIDAFFMWLFGAKKEMAKTNQQGMELLKKAVENN